MSERADLREERTAELQVAFDFAVESGTPVMIPQWTAQWLLVNLDTPDGERIEGWLDCSHDDLPEKWEPQTWARFSAGNPLRDSVPATLIIHGEPSRESEPERRTLEEWAEWFDNPNESPTFAVRDIRQNQSEMHTPGYLMRRIIEDLPESGREESDA